MWGAMSHLVLVGMMGAGKTAVGSLVAERLGRPFVDTDDLVEVATGMGVAGIFATQGEERFRELEGQAVRDACAAPTPSVIACGGGAVVSAENRRVMRAAGRVVWLRASGAVLANRVGDGAGRPLLGSGSSAATLQRLARVREAAYEAAAHVIVDTEDLGVDEVAERVLEACGR